MMQIDTLAETLEENKKKRVSSTEVESVCSSADYHLIALKKRMIKKIIIIMMMRIKR